MSICDAFHHKSRKQGNKIILKGVELQEKFEMSIAEIFGSIGVALLLGAFFMNLFGLMSSDSRAYQAINAIGAGISCYASYLIGFAPFVILEATWCAVAVIAMIRPTRG